MIRIYNRIRRERERECESSHILNKSKNNGIRRASLVEETDAKFLVFSRALREKKEPRVKSLSLIKMGNNTATPIPFDDDEERR